MLVQRLLQLSAADVHQLTASKLDADLLLDAIQELRDHKVCLLLQTSDCTDMLPCKQFPGKCPIIKTA